MTTRRERRGFFSTLSEDDRLLIDYARQGNDLDVDDTRAVVRMLDQLDRERATLHEYANEHDIEPVYTAAGVQCAACGGEVYWHDRNDLLTLVHAPERERHAAVGPHSMNGRRWATCDVCGDEVVPTIRRRRTPYGWEHVDGY